jgi:hypothetical protein
MLRQGVLSISYNYRTIVVQPRTTFWCPSRVCLNSVDRALLGLHSTFNLYDSCSCYSERVGREGLDVDDLWDQKDRDVHRAKDLA